MIKFSKSISLILLSLILMIASSAIYVSAAEDELILDGKISYKVGDTITYDLCLQSPETVVGIQMDLNYDKEYLKIDTESVDTPKFAAATINPNLDGYLTFNWTNVTKAAKFSEKSKMLTVNFKVLKAGKTNITYFIEEMYSTDLTYLKEYTITVDYSQNGTIVKENEVPIVETNTEFLDKHQGDFLNFEDGKGQNNTDVEDERTIVTSPNKTNEPAANNYNNNNQNAAQNVNEANGNNAPTNAQGEVLPTDEAGNYLDENGDILTIDENGNYVDKNGNIYQTNTPAENPNLVPMIIIIIVVLAAIGIVIIIIMKSRSTDNNSTNLEQSAENTEPELEDNNLEEPASQPAQNAVKESSDNPDLTDETK